MIIQCPQCATTYDLPDGSIGPEGRQVKCAKCQENWHATAVDVDQDAPDFLKPQRQESPEGDSDFASDNESDSLEDKGSSETSEDHGEEEESLNQSEVEALFDSFDVEDDDEEAEATDVMQASDISEAADDQDIKSGEVVEAQAVDHYPVEKAPSAARKKKAAKKKLPQSSMQPKMLIAATIAGLLMIISALMFRQDIVRLSPDTASLYETIGLPVNIRGLEFVNLETELDVDQGRSVLKIEGDLVNIATQDRHVPSIRFSLLSAGGEEVYAWSIDPDVDQLSRSGTYHFQTHLASPPAEARKVKLRFSNRKNLNKA